MYKKPVLSGFFSAFWNEIEFFVRFLCVYIYANLLLVMMCFKQQMFYKNKELIG